MRTGWSRWNRLAGTTRFPDEAPGVVLSVEPIPVIPGHGQGPGGRVRWEVARLVKDPTLPLGARLATVVAGNADDCSAGRAAVERAYRAMDAAARAGEPVVDSQVTDREQGPQAPRASERTAQEVQE